MPQLEAWFEAQLEADQFRENLLIRKAAPILMVTAQGSPKDLNKQLELLSDVFVGKDKNYEADVKDLMGAFGGSSVVKQPTKDEMAQYGKSSN